MTSGAVRRSRHNRDSQSGITDRQNQNRPRPPSSSIRSPIADGGDGGTDQRKQRLGKTMLTHAQFPEALSLSANADTHAAHGRRRERLMR